MTTFSYKHPLAVSTPLMSGPKVEEAQKLLAGRGPVLKRECYTGKIDGQYGEESAHGCHRAKYWLGYPNKECNGVFGQHLFFLLTGVSKPSPFMRWRIRHRTKLAKKRTETGGLYRRAINEAAKYVGYKDNPVGEHNIFGAWYGMDGVPWCAIFQSYVLTHVGHRFRYSYVPAIVADARMGRNGMSTTPYSEVANHIKAGHPVLACFDFAGTGVADHVGMIDHVVSDAEFATIEGNTGQVSFQNGGEVMRCQRFTSSVQAFVVIYGK